EHVRKTSRRQRSRTVPISRTRVESHPVHNAPIDAPQAAAGPRMAARPLAAIVVCLLILTACHHPDPQTNSATPHTARATHTTPIRATATDASTTREPGYPARASTLSALSGSCAW